MIGKSQSVEFYAEEAGEPIGENIAGTTIEFVVDGDHDVTFILKNTSGFDLSFKAERVKLEDIPGTQDFMVVGGSGEFGDIMYATDFMSPQNPFITPDVFNFEGDLNGYLSSYFIFSEGEGCVHYRYYILDEFDARIDSIDVRYCATVAVGVEENFSKNITVYPNPANSNIRIKIPSELKANYKLVVTNLQGQQVAYKENYQSETDMNLTALETGVYVLSILDSVTDTELFMTKIVLE